MEKVRYGIIGIGKMGSGHAKRLKAGLDKNAALTAVCDIAEDRREWAKQSLKDVTVFDDYRELIQSPSVDAVVVATPHYLHPTIAIEALNAGKHVLIEKPAGVYTKAVELLNETAKQNGSLVFGIMYNQRSNPLYKKAKSI
ncbi:MAG: Gfo/Idh/MocA family oxidoreductase, partial [Clostridiales bacterium]|nr:Gfo/Idh/MocA family oxidoreductase [Clostridiales bacterium]